MASKCTITFNNNPLGVYYAGQIVSGTVELITNRPKTIRSILITINGFAEVRWTENIIKQDTHGERKKSIETYSASEVYYNNENCVYGKNGGAQIDLPSGKYVFPFQTTIPQNAPTSFNGSHGQIQHEVCVTIDRVMRYNNVFKQPFTVLSPLDLNLYSEYSQPFHKTDEKAICWSLCCSTEGPLVLTVNVPFSGYTPGQKVPFNIILDNQLDVNCSDVKVRLMKKVMYSSQAPDIKTKETQIKLADNHCGGVIKLNKAEFNEHLQIPSTTPSLENCKIIKIFYTLKFIAKISRIHGNLIIDCPLTIGTVPIYATIFNTKGIITNQPGVSNFYKQLTPLKYEEDVCNEQFENNTYKPFYPIFSNDSKSEISRGGSEEPSATQPSQPNSNNSCYPALQIDPIIPSAPKIEESTNENIATTADQLPRKGTNPLQPLEVLGFSIPPDYEPTPNTPARDLTI